MNRSGSEPDRRDRAAFRNAVLCCSTPSFSALESGWHHSSIEGLNRSFAVILSGAPRSQRSRDVTINNATGFLDFARNDFCVRRFAFPICPRVSSFSVAVRYEIRDAEFCRRRTRCTRRLPGLLRRARSPDRSGAEDFGHFIGAAIAAALKIASA